MNTKLSLIAMGASALLTTSYVSAADQPAQHFVKESIQGNLAEVKVGNLAERKGASQGVKDFGAMLARDHAAANEKAQQAATALGVTPPSGPSVKQKAMYTELAALSGETFDKHFVKAMLKDHQEDIAKYEKEANGSGPAADYAKAILPHLHAHLEMAQHLQQEERTATAPDTSKSR